MDEALGIIQGDETILYDTLMVGVYHDPLV